MRKPYRKRKGLGTCFLAFSLQVTKSLHFCLIPFDPVSYYSAISIIKIYELKYGIEDKQNSSLGLRRIC
jgi:hypothetical protein